MAVEITALINTQARGPVGPAGTNGTDATVTATNVTAAIAAASDAQAAEMRGDLGAQEWVNVKTDHGAVGNGLADDTAAIQAACDTGKNVYFPEGTYIISAEIVLDAHKGTLNGVAFSGQQFMGAGIRQTTIKQVTAAANGFRSTTSDSYLLVWSDMTLESTAGWTSTGAAFSSSSGLNLWWQLQRVCVHRWQHGYRVKSVQCTIQDCYFLDCNIGIWFEASPGIGINRNTVARCGMAPSGNAGQTAARPEHTAVRISGGYGHFIDGLDVGGPKMSRIVHVEGNSSGIVRGLSCEIHGTVGLTTSMFDSRDAGIGYWLLQNCNAAGFSGQQSTDWPIFKNRFTTLNVESCGMSGGWANGMIRADQNDLGAGAPLFVLGASFKIDVWNLGTSAIDHSYYSSPFTATGGAVMPSAATYHGRMVHDLRQGGQDDGLILGMQRVGTAQFGWDNLNQYNSDNRNGRFYGISYAEIPASGITASASATAATTTPAMMLDGNDVTLWRHQGSVAGGAAFVKFDLATAKRVARMRFFHDEVGVLTVTVSGSNNDSTYTEIGRFKTTAVGDLTVLTNPSTAYRYIRLNFATTNTAWLGIKTVQFWRPVITGEIVGSETATYANDAAADADANLPSGAYYLITGGRTLYRKP